MCARTQADWLARPGLCRSGAVSAIFPSHLSPVPPPRLLMWRTHEDGVKVPGPADFTLTLTSPCPERRRFPPASWRRALNRCASRHGLPVSSPTAAGRTLAVPGATTRTRPSAGWTEPDPPASSRRWSRSCSTETSGRSRPVCGPRDRTCTPTAAGTHPSSRLRSRGRGAKIRTAQGDRREPQTHAAAPHARGAGRRRFEGTGWAVRPA
jgi:hypothetical protein